MPFTPFHLGPGALFKAVAGDHFSFMVFGGSQILIDLEPAVRLMTGSAILHGFTHTLLGALLIGTLAGGIGKPVTERVLRGTDTMPQLHVAGLIYVRLHWHPLACTT